MTPFLRHALRSTALAALLIGASSPASAVMIGTICDDIACSGRNDIVLQDNQAGDTIAVVGAMSFSTSAFGYSLLVNTSQSKPVLGSATAPQLDLTFTATTNDAVSHSVFLYVSDTDFSTSGQFLLTLGGTNSGGSGSVTGRAWGGTNNTALSFSGANLLASVGPLTGAAYSGSASGAFASSVSPYSLTAGVAITRSTAGTSTGDLNFVVGAVPEPGTWGLMLLGFGGIGLAMRRRKALRPVCA